MNRLLLAVALWVGLFGAGWARTVEEQLLATLQSQGYVILEQGYTFLGRLRVVAQNGELRREIVINPGTGEILRDYAVMLPEVAASPTPSGAGSTATASPTQGSGSAGVAGASTGVPDDQTVASSVDNATVAGTDAQPVEEDGMTDGLVAPEVILVDPILPFSAEDQ